MYGEDGSVIGLARDGDTYVSESQFRHEFAMDEKERRIEELNMIVVGYNERFKEIARENQTTAPAIYGKINASAIAKYGPPAAW